MTCRKQLGQQASRPQRTSCPSFAVPNLANQYQSIGNVAELGTEQLVGADVLIGPQRRNNVHHVVLEGLKDLTPVVE